MTREMWLGVARHILTVIGGIFVAKGYTDAGTLNVIIGGAVAAGGVAWSIVEKKQR